MNSSRAATHTVPLKSEIPFVFLREGEEIFCSPFLQAALNTDGTT